MDQAKPCFKQPFSNKLQPLKKKLAKVRIPDAKMEKTGKRIPVTSNRSPWMELIESKDLLIGDPEDPFSARELIDEYFEVIYSLKPSDVICSMRNPIVKHWATYPLPQKVPFRCIHSARIRRVE